MKRECIQISVERRKARLFVLLKLREGLKITQTHVGTKTDLNIDTFTHSCINTAISVFVSIYNTSCDNVHKGV